MSISAKEIAYYARCSADRVYQLRKFLGRMPIVDEVIARKGKRGAPKKELSRDFVGSDDAIVAFLAYLIEHYGEDATMREVWDRAVRKEEAKVL
jgi:hypothetical protein